MTAECIWRIRARRAISAGSVSSSSVSATSARSSPSTPPPSSTSGPGCGEGAIGTTISRPAAEAAAWSPSRSAMGY